MLLTRQEALTAANTIDGNLTSNPADNQPSYGAQDLRVCSSGTPKTGRGELQNIIAVIQEMDDDTWDDLQARSIR